MYQVNENKTQRQGCFWSYFASDRIRFIANQFNLIPPDIRDLIISWQALLIGIGNNNGNGRKAG